MGKKCTPGPQPACYQGLEFQETTNASGTGLDVMHGRKNIGPGCFPQGVCSLVQETILSKHSRKCLLVTPYLLRVTSEEHIVTNKNGQGTRMATLTVEK